MTLGRIGGPMLKENLVRQGVDLAFETDLVYLDVNNMRVGINQAVPQVDLHIDGNTRSGNVQLGGNTISSTDTNGNINLTPNGSGSTVVSRLSTPNVITSTLANGTAPFVVTSTTQVANLNVANAGHSTTANTVVDASQPNITSVGTMTALNVNAQANATVFSSNVATGTAPLIVTSTTQVANLNVAAAGTAVTAGSATTAGTVTTAAQPNITSVGVLTSLTVDNIQVADNTISSVNTNGNILLDPNGTGQVKILGTNAVTVPAGGTLDRPAGTTGDLRLNTSSNAMEFYDGTSWKELSSASVGITSDAYQGDGSTLNFTLTEASTTESVIVTINGVLQSPGDSYSVTSTTLTFFEAPLVGDRIDVRYLSTATVTSALQDIDTSITVNGTADLANITSGGNLVVQVTPTAVLPGANVTYDLGSSTMRWKDVWLSGSTVRLGSVVLKDTGGSFGVYQSDGSTPAAIIGTAVTANTGNIAFSTATISSAGLNEDITLDPNGTGNVAVVGNLNVNGNVTASRLISNIATGTAPFTVTSTTQVANLNVANAGYATSAGSATSATTAGTVTTAAQPNITSVGNLTIANIDNIQIDSNAISSTNVNGNIDISPNGTGNINLNNPTQVSSTVQATRFISNIATGTAPFTVTSTTQVANLNVAAAGTATTAGTVTASSQPNITSVGTLTLLGVSGDVTASRFVSNVATGSAPLIVTSTTQVANLNVATAGTAGTVTTAAQPNITSVGTLTNLQTTSLGVGTAASGTTGEIRATNEVTAYYGSDRNLKTNITPIEDALSKLRQISGVMFDWTDSEVERRGGEDGYFVRKHDTGVIAQEVERVLPEVVATRDDGYKAVKYEKLAGLIIQAVNELADQVDELKKKVG